jgi:DegV family protein with EDD domain
MSRVCILTDSSAQFTQTDYPGHERVHVIPFNFQKGVQQEGSSLLRKSCFPGQMLVPPGCQDFIHYYERLGKQCDSILVITISAHLSSCLNNARQAARLFSNHAAVEMVDSQQVSVGLGYLVQEAAALACAGETVENIIKYLRCIMPNIYLVLCIPELSCLARSGYLSHAQGIVGEIIGMLPVFTLEEGCLVPMDKVRNERHLFDTFQDFLSEFNSPDHISLIRGDGHRDARVRLFRAFAGSMFPGTPFSEHPIQPALTGLFGEGSTGLVIMEKTRTGVKWI